MFESVSGLAELQSLGLFLWQLRACVCVCVSVFRRRWNIISNRYSPLEFVEVSMDFIGWKFSFSQIWKYEFQSPMSILGQSGHFAVEVTHRLLWEVFFFLSNPASYWLIKLDFHTRVHTCEINFYYLMLRPFVALFVFWPLPFCVVGAGESPVGAGLWFPGWPHRLSFTGMLPAQGHHVSCHPCFTGKLSRHCWHIV